MLRRFTLEDAPHIFELDNTPGVMTYLPFPIPQNLEQSREMLQSIIQEYEDFGVSRLIIELQSTGEFIGWAGLKFCTNVMNGHSNYYDVGYRLLPKHWGKGYATEAARASVEYGFQQLKLPTLNAMAMHGNEASKRVLEKSGLRYVNDFMCNGEPHWWFEMISPL